MSKFDPADGPSPQGLQTVLENKNIHVPNGPWPTLLCSTYVKIMHAYE